MNRGTLVFYINAIHEGGAERVIIQLAKHFSESGFRSILVTSFLDENEYPVPNYVERIVIDSNIKYSSRLEKNIKRIIGLRRILIKEKPKAIISFMAEPNFRAVMASRGLKIKVITSVRNDPNKEYHGVLGGFIGKHIIPLADGCVFQTQDAQAWFKKSLQRKSTIIFNDVDPIFFEKEWRGGDNIVTLGRLCEQKNQKMLIDAFAQISSRYPNVNLQIYGIGPLEIQLRQYIAELNMEHRIKLMGLTNNAADVYQSSKLFVLSSDYEGMPNALLEAMAIGVPCISTDCPCGGPRMIIEDKKNGILVPVNNVEKLAEAMDLLLCNSQYAIELANQAKNSSSQYKTDMVFKQWKDYVEHIIET